jgi:thioredoxin reductase (NADPH)
MKPMTDLVVIGAGPAGLSCAIEAQKAGLTTVVFEKGSIVDAIRRFPTNLVWFSTPELLEIGDVPFVVSTVRPTRVDTINYYQKVARFHRLDIRYHDPVVALRPDGESFLITTGHDATYRARFVVVATGYFDHPNRLGVPGEEQAHVSHYYREPFECYERDVVVVGGRNSAVEAALDLFRHGASVTLVHRGMKLSEGVKYWILPDIENRIKAGEIHALFGSTVQEIGENTVRLRTPVGVTDVRGQHVFVLVGFLPDTHQLLSFGITLDPVTLAPVINPDTFETNVRGVFVAGSVIAGRNTNKIFVENGRLHGPAIVRCIRSRIPRIS